MWSTLFVPMYTTDKKSLHYRHDYSAFSITISITVRFDVKLFFHHKKIYRTTNKWNPWKHGNRYYSTINWSFFKLFNLPNLMSTEMFQYQINLLKWKWLQTHHYRMPAYKHNKNTTTAFQSKIMNITWLTAGRNAWKKNGNKSYSKQYLKRYWKIIYPTKKPFTTLRKKAPNLG